MKKLINKVEDIVQEMCDGIAANSNKKLRKLKDCNVIVRKKIDTNKVALISGGGSGHEPAHAGYVGKGMLSAAVCGEIFTSPTPDMILNAITARLVGKMSSLLESVYAWLLNYTLFHS